MTWTKEEQKQHRQELVAALLSGKYAQDRNFLRTAAGYCCLGVGCDVAAPALGGRWSGSPLADEGYAFSAPWVTPHDVDEKFFSMPTKVREYYGFKTGWGRFVTTAPSGLKIERSLQDLNDRGVSFREIAMVISEEPDELIE